MRLSSSILFGILRQKGAKSAKKLNFSPFGEVFLQRYYKETKKKRTFAALRPVEYTFQSPPAGSFDYARFSSFPQFASEK
jgi:hypothetical protein